MKRTSHYLLKKIELTDTPPDITVINDNWDTIDGELHDHATEVALTSEHRQNNNIHITAAERTAWDGKAAGNHNHSALYAPLTHSNDETIHVSASEKAKLAQLDIGDKTTVVVGLSGTHDSLAVDFLASATNAATAIKNAINSVAAIGGRVQLLEGVYQLTETIAISKGNIQISGVGDGTFLQSTSSLTNGLLRLTGSRITIADMRLGSDSIGINALGAQTTIRDVMLQACNIGVQGSSTSSLLIVERCHFSSCTKGLYQVGQNGCFTGNVYQYCTTAVELTSGPNTTTNNSFLDNEVGIRLLSGKGNLIQGNVITRGSGNSSNYTSSQETIRIESGATYNLIAGNVLAGKDVTDASGNSTNVKQMNLT